MAIIGESVTTSTPEQHRRFIGTRAGRLAAGATALTILAGAASGCAVVNKVEKNNAQASILQGEPITAALNCAGRDTLQKRVIVEGGTSKPNSAWTADIGVTYTEGGHTEHGDFYVGGRYKIKPSNEATYKLAFNYEDAVNASGYSPRAVGTRIGYYGGGKGADVVEIDVLSSNAISAYCYRSGHEAKDADVEPIKVTYINPPADGPVVLGGAADVHALSLATQENLG
ncbi:MAG TPA: hypothetical protein VIM53_01360 [Candidatus Saccharimonadales bacterium]